MQHKRVWLLGWLMAGLLLTLACTRPSEAEVIPERDETSVAQGGCQVFPPDNIWNTRIDTLPVHSRSDDYIDTIGRDTGLHADFGSGTWNGGPIGIPFKEVNGNQPLVDIYFHPDGWPDESDREPAPIPYDAPIEGGPESNGDRHVLVVDRDNCKLYELYRAFPRQGGGWEVMSSAYYDLNSHALREDGYTSADAAGLPIYPGLVRYEEVHSQYIIPHALRFTAPETQMDYVWPARHYASDITDPRYPPMGQRFRLKADFDISGYSPDIRVILRTMQVYGIILADNGSPWYISGAPNAAWNNDELHEWDDITGDNFEAVDVSSLMLHPDSGQVRPTAVFDHWTFIPVIRK
jgi:hypothetical protein